jgi:2-dehydropantoate 2-reductase
MTAYTAGLELAGWSLREYRGSQWLGRVASASREGVLSQLTRRGKLQRLLLRVTLSPANLRLMTALLPLLFPFDIEAYLKFHYLKTREQTLSLLSLFIKDGSAKGIQATNLEALLSSLSAPHSP